MSKIVWALDVLGEKTAQTKVAAQYLKLLQKEQSFDVEPAYLASKTNPELALEFSVPAQDRFTAFPKAKLAKLLKPYRSTLKLLEPQIVVDSHYSEKQKTLTFIKRWELQKDVAFLVLTHLKAKLEKFVVGSFAEKVLALSDKPVFVLHPGMKMPKKLHRWLIAIDLDHMSESWIKNLEHYTKGSKKHITLFHSLTLPVELMMESDLESLLEEMKQQAFKRIMPAADFLKSSGHDVDIVIPFSGVSIDSAIMAETKKHKIDMLVMGRFGSSSKRVIRTHRLPALFLP